MSKKTILIANRGEIAIRLARACKEAGLGSVAVFSADDESSLHVRRADRAVALQGVGAAAYLNVDNIVVAAREAGCDAVHPGYGFLSESPALADACRDAGIHFIGPPAATLSLFGDKVAARAIARDCAVPVPRGTSGATSLEEAKAFYADLGSGRGMMIKAVSGGGGRGMRQVQKAEEIEEAYARCRSEAQAAFGRGDVYVEELIPNARHIEVQVLGDGRGGVTHFGERECSIQRRHQKVIEIAPSPTLSAALRTSLVRSACRMAEHVKYLGLGTFEFLVAEDGSFVFIETNPRLQVEHTITEEVYGVDLVRAQISVCLGRSLAELGLRQSDVSEPRGYAIQLRVNMETMNPDGSANPAGGTITAYDPPS
jgi:pyruvate carboxylase